MRKEFLDECKDFVYEFVASRYGERYITSDEVVDALRDEVNDQLIWYNQGAFARENYTDELADAFENAPYLFEGSGLNPFYEEFSLAVFREALETTTVYMLESVLDKLPPNEPIVLEGRVVSDVAETLDKWTIYPYDKNYWYRPEEDSSYYRRKAFEDLGVSRTIKVSREVMGIVKQSKIVSEAEETLGKDWKRETADASEQQQEKGLKL